MAMSQALAAVCQEVSFTAGTNPVTVTAGQELTCISPGGINLPCDESSLGTQFVTVEATHSVAAGTATIVFFKADDDSAGTPAGAGKIAQDICTITGLNSTRQSHNTAAGDYVASVVFGISGTRTLDLGHHGKPWPKWYVGCQAISGGTVTLRIYPGRAI